MTRRQTDASYGLKRLSQGNAIDVVFVHGLNGHREETWKAPTGDLWILNWLVQDTIDVAIWTYGYPNGALEWTSNSATMTLKQRAINLLNDLQLSKLGTDRPVLFVCHSMGGLVVKKALVEAQTLASSPKNHDHAFHLGLVENMKKNGRVLFLATPHKGAALATILTNVIRIFLTVAVSQLRALSEELKTLNDNYIKLDIRSLCLCETKAYNGVLVVPENSSRLSEEHMYVPVDHHHVSIAKPSSKADLVYQNVLNLLPLKQLPIVKTQAQIDLSELRKLAYYLLSQMRNNREMRTIVFVGPQGVGKSSLQNSLSRALQGNVVPPLVFANSSGRGSSARSTQHIKVRPVPESQSIGRDVVLRFVDTPGHAGCSEPKDTSFLETICEGVQDDEFIINRQNNGITEPSTWIMNRDNKVDRGIIVLSPYEIDSHLEYVKFAKRIIEEKTKQTPTVVFTKKDLKSVEMNKLEKFSADTGCRVFHVQNYLNVTLQPTLEETETVCLEALIAIISHT